jgi:predicted nucleic acid-binding protein
MGNVVVDASVVVKWFVEEEETKEALEIRDGHIEGRVKIIAPELMPFEALNALHHKRLFETAELVEISDALEAYSFDLRPLRGDYARRTLEIAEESHLTVYDATYIALAEMEGARFVTSDLKMVGKLKGRYRLFSKGLHEKK